MEFDLIDAIRVRTRSARGNVVLGIGDDAALLDVPAGQRLVACTDTLVEGVHFLPDTAPEDLGWKSLAVNLSDLAAMGAEPAWALLALTLPVADAHFVERFADGFAELARAHGVALVGGDTTQGPLSITVTALGCVPHAAALTRAGAHVGDAVFVTGTLGDAAGALRLIRDSDCGSGRPERTSAQPMAGWRAAGSGEFLGTRDSELVARMHRPEPRVAAGLALRGIANACIDVSDGLVADLSHVCAGGGVAAELDADALPLSAALRATFDDAACRGFALSGGDDYELCFTAPVERAEDVDRIFSGLGLRVTRIGRIAEGSGVCVVDADGNAVDIMRAGWEHFRP
ncbi:MAG: Thiamine-monophosphate kinase [Rhodanobacteraceae bacterium]|jgi:thiamine-monophosphate kinase|nr:MAG: Thiamine-monophosphate kinase [Rhodanobacteraceae bacterium]